MIRRYCLIAFILLASDFVYAELKFPPPDFDSGYKLPLTEVQKPKDSNREYIDAAVLLVSLSLCAWLVYYRRNRKAIFLLMLFSLIYFGFYRKGCVCPIGAIGNVSLTAFDPEYAVPIAAAFFFILPLVFSLFFGRVFCSAVCPLGAIQDLVVLKPLRLPAWLEHGLRLFAYIYLAAAVLFAATGSLFLICRYDPFVGFFRRDAKINMIVLGLCFLVVGTIVARPYCRFVCPYGLILRLLSRLSRKRVTITPDECIKCRLCEDSCPFGAIEKPSVEWPPENYAPAKTRLGLLILALPVIVAVLAFAGSLLSDPMSRVNPTVRLAERIYLENTQQVTRTTPDKTQAPNIENASTAWRSTGETAEQLNTRAKAVQNQFRIGGWFFGGFIGLVIAVKLIALVIRKPVEDYQAHRAGCLACGRCYSYCPQEHVRLENKKLGKENGNR